MDVGAAAREIIVVQLGSRGAVRNFIVVFEGCLGLVAQIVDEVTADRIEAPIPSLDQESLTELVDGARDTPCTAMNSDQRVIVEEFSSGPTGPGKVLLDIISNPSDWNR